MTKFSALFAAVVVAFAGVAVAADAPAAPIVLEAKPGNVSFSHKTHAAVKCEQCHTDAKGGDIAGIGKDMNKEAAHKACTTCHKEQAKGPQKCAECHKKA